MRRGPSTSVPVHRAANPARRSTSDRRLRAAYVVAAARAWLLLRCGDRARARERAADALTLAETLGEPHAILDAIDALVVCVDDPDEHAALLARCEELAPRALGRALDHALLRAWIELHAPGTTAACAEEGRRAPRPATRRLAELLFSRVKDAAVVRIAEDGAWLEVGADRVELGARAAMRRVLARLAEQHRAAPGVGVSSDELFTHGWPGHDPPVEVARARVYQTTTRLRRLGLGKHLRTQHDGLCLDPCVVVVRARP